MFFIALRLAHPGLVAGVVARNDSHPLRQALPDLQAARLPSGPGPRRDLSGQDLPDIDVEG